MMYERPPTNPFQNPPNIIYEHEVASMRAQVKQLFRNKNIWVEMHACIAWDMVDNPSLQSTLQVLPSFEEYTPPVTYPEEVDKTIGILMEVEPSNHIKLEDLGLNTNTHDLFLSFKGFPSVDESEP
nr:ribonuclease H-like domain-containing protein [Tanacetum cinerariifolium]